MKSAMERVSESRKSGTNVPPGPRGLPLLGSSLSVQRDTLGFFDAARTYGDIYRFKLLSPVGILTVHVLSRPEYVRHVLRDHQANYRKSGAYDRLSAVIGNGLLTSEGDFWRRQRRLAQPAFHRSRLALLGKTMTAATEEMLAQRWEAAARAGTPLDVAEEMTRLTLTIVGRTMLSTDLADRSSEVGQAVRYLLEYTDRRIKAVAVLPESVPTPRNRRFRRSLKILDDLVYTLIDERRGQGEDRGDLLSMLAAARDEETGEAMSERQLRDELMTILIAGHETTAAALSWAWYLLSKHPEVARTMTAELDSVLGGRPPTFDDLPSLPYTGMVFKETLRLYPPGWMIARIAREYDEIGGYAIPKGSRVAVSPYVVHRNPALWENPEGFDPERFAPGRATGRPDYAYFPFGGGPRKCIGGNFATMEATLVLATVAQRYLPELVPGFRVRPEAAISLRPKEGLPMILRPFRTPGRS